MGIYFLEYWGFHWWGSFQGILTLCIIIKRFRGARNILDLLTNTGRYGYFISKTQRSGTKQGILSADSMVVMEEVTKGLILNVFLKKKVDFSIFGFFKFNGFWIFVYFFSFLFFNLENWFKFGSPAYISQIWLITRI